MAGELIALAKELRVRLKEIPDEAGPHFEVFRASRKHPYARLRRRSMSWEVTQCDEHGAPTTVRRYFPGTSVDAFIECVHRLEQWRGDSIEEIAVI